MDNEPTLYLIPTPIGNLDDITIRSLNVLRMVDLILCEDTRETSKLLSKYDINKKLISCHEFNEEKIKGNVLQFLKDGLSIGLVTDQGTPLISDPGYKIVDYIAKNKFNIVSLPGATAFVPALTISAIAPLPFTFYGFLNAKKSKQLSELEKLKNYPFTLIFYEAPHRLIETLNNIKEIFGNRKVCVAREISKKYEQAIRGKISEVLMCEFPIKGEFVIVVEGNNDKLNYDDMDIITHVDYYINDGVNKNDAIKLVAKERGVPKSYIYKEYLSKKQ